jgi:hypothetical protein
MLINFKQQISYHPPPPPPPPQYISATNILEFKQSETIKHFQTAFFNWMDLLLVLFKEVNKWKLESV